jgi:hypothetical protein
VIIYVNVFKGLSAIALLLVAAQFIVAASSTSSGALLLRFRILPNIPSFVQMLQNVSSSIGEPKNAVGCRRTEQEVDEKGRRRL